MSQDRFPEFVYSLRKQAFKTNSTFSLDIIYSTWKYLIFLSHLALLPNVSRATFQLRYRRVSATCHTFPSFPFILCEDAEHAISINSYSVPNDLICNVLNFFPYNVCMHPSTLLNCGFISIALARISISNNPFVVIWLTLLDDAVQKNKMFLHFQGNFHQGTCVFTQASRRNAPNRRTNFTKKCN